MSWVRTKTCKTSKLRQEGTLTGWSAADQSMIETVDEPLNTSQVVSGLGDIIARLSSDAEHLRPAPKRGGTPLFWL